MPDLLKLQRSLNTSAVVAKIAFFAIAALTILHVIGLIIMSLAIGAPTFAIGVVTYATAAAFSLVMSKRSSHMHSNMMDPKPRNVRWVLAYWFVTVGLIIVETIGMSMIISNVFPKYNQMDDLFMSPFSAILLTVPAMVMLLIPSRALDAITAQLGLDYAGQVWSYQMAAVSQAVTPQQAATALQYGNRPSLTGGREIYRTPPHITR